MKKIWIFGLSLLGATLLCTPTWAGTWNLSLDYAGTSIGGPGWGHTGNTAPWGYGGWTGDDGEGQGTETSNLTPGQKQDGSLNGSFILVARWRPTQAGEVLPPVLHVKFRQTMAGSGSRQSESQFAGAASSTPGQVHLSVSVANPDGTQATDTEHVTATPNATMYRFSALAESPTTLLSLGTQGAVAQNDGSYIIRHSLPALSGTFSVTNGLYKVENDPGVFSNYGDGSNAYLSAGVTYDFDPRSVKLTRNDKDRFELDANGNWVTYGDSRFSYLERVIIPGQTGEPSSYSDDPYDVIQTIVANREGTWAPDPQKVWTVPGGISYSVSAPNVSPPSVLVITTQGNSVSNPDGIDMIPAGDTSSAAAGAITPGWYNVPSQGNKQFTVTHKVIDTGTGGDGATATATYIMTLHDEWEDPIPDPDFVRHQAGGQPDVSGESVTDWNYIIAGLPHLEPGSQTPVLDYGPDSSWDVTEGAKFSVSLEQGFGVEFKLNDWANAHGDIKTTEELTVDATAIASAGKPSDLFPGAATGTRYQPIIAYRRRQVHKLLKRYDNSGLWLNPATAQLPPANPRYGRWPQSKEEGVMEWGPNWLKVLPGQTPLQPQTTGFLSASEG